ncbi:Hypothetical protein R9X50_00691000 [Acrodontium crateriforme]|uniref:EDC4-like protein pdc1 beta-propeller domain-containing protein n=1 Tax=Acrodontium crateriforme TaxID=150365 RepID=A0AAQ3R757_9PEZI|nr:Hypothetical protein R9X50_00691000 [Acrodontium crateriforme]
MDPRVDELFARLKSSNAEGRQQQQQGYRQPSVSSPLFSPPSYTPNPIHSSDIISPVNPSSIAGSPAPDTNRTHNLLNLLKLNNQPVQGAPLATLQNATENKQQNVSRAPSTSNQDFLLNLLKKPSIAPAQLPVESTLQAASSISRESTRVHHFGSPDVGKTAFESPQPSKESLFNYVNPFDQLHSSSPLNSSLPNQEANKSTKKVEILKHGRDISTSQNNSSPMPAAKTCQIESENTPPASEITESQGDSQSVSKTLEGLGEKLDKQVEKALAEAAAQHQISGDHREITPPETEKDAVTGDDVDSSWESAEDSANDKKLDFNVKVYNFPMKPFVAIQIKDIPEPVIPIRQDDFMVIASLKKEFDQIDRCLATASQTHIVYAQTANKKDNNGFRIIRQDSGDHKQVFRASGERVFNVQLCNSSANTDDTETVLGTGVNGSIFWTTLVKSRDDLFKDEDVESHGFIMPPVATAEENTSGSPVKTRVKMSSRHPEYFGMARGKLIHIIAPENAKDKAYCDPKTRKVNSEKFLAEHGLRISTGKAGKDFCFSEDDTIIVSLDKSGRVKFWDIRDLTARACDTTEGKHRLVEITEPMWSVNAAASGSRIDEKPSVSSIMLLDKERPYNKGLQLRYMLVGFKQNHILQLWDLGLGKAVQEIRLPHEKDSDGICSLGYHPKTGILAIGHPTRNSIYFLHLSAPRYNIPAMDQARFITCLARNDPSLPKPESTAIMSGLREFSFDRVGQIRSIDMLKTPVDNAGDDETLFELYVMHSKGVVGISIKRADLGWDKDSKMISPIDAVTVGAAEVTDLRLPQPKDANNASEPTSIPETPSKKATEKKENKKEVSRPSSKAEAVKSAPAQPITSTANNARIETDRPTTQSSRATADAPPSYSVVTPRIKSPAMEPAAKDSGATTHRSATSVSSTPTDTNLLAKHFDSLYQRLDADKRVSDAAGAAKQDAMLRLVSSTLTENVEQSLHRIIGASIEKDVIPRLGSTTSKIIEQHLNSILPQQLSNSVQHEVKTALPVALQQALKDPQVQRTISDIIAKQVATTVQQQVSALLQKSLPNMATEASQRMVSEVERRISQQLHRAETQHQQDNLKIEELSNLVRGLSMTVKNMAESQVSFQEQILKTQQDRSKTSIRVGDVTDAAASSTKTTSIEKPAPEDYEVTRITEMLVAGEYEEATIQWLQSARQGELFDLLFVRVNPEYLRQVTPLVALSVSAAITASFDTNTDQRLDWLSNVLSQINIKDQDIMDVAPKIMDVLGQRLQGAYMQISEANPNDIALRKISALNKQVNDVRRMTG